MTGWMLLVAAMCNGVFTPFQTGCNARLAKSAGHPILAAITNTTVGTLSLLAIALVVIRPRLPGGSALSQAPWWAWCGGILGACYLANNTALAPSPRLRQPDRLPPLRRDPHRPRPRPLRPRRLRTPAGQPAQAARRRALGGGGGHRPKILTTPPSSRRPQPQTGEFLHPVDDRRLGWQVVRCELAPKKPAIPRVNRKISAASSRLGDRPAVAEDEEVGADLPRGESAIAWTRRADLGEDQGPTWRRSSPWSSSRRGGPGYPPPPRPSGGLPRDCGHRDK